MKPEKPDKLSHEFLKPFVYTLPDDSTQYVPLLQKGQSVKMWSGCVTLQPGEEVGSHNTNNCEELIIVLEGSGVVEAESVGRRNIAKRQIAYNPPQTEHNIVNTGKKSMRYIFVVSEAVSK